MPHDILKSKKMPCFGGNDWLSENTNVEKINNKKAKKRYNQCMTDC